MGTVLDHKQGKVYVYRNDLFLDSHTFFSSQNHLEN